VSPDAPVLGAVVDAVADRIGAPGTAPLVLGICGSQGSGKSTLATALARHFEDAGVATAILSIDDIYLTLAEREALARDIHPLLRTRGVPGTHDIALGRNVLAQLDAGVATPLPRFDKAQDDRAPREEWDVSAPDTRLVILEGWCVGARPEAEQALVTPINALERDEDADSRWRTYVNTALGRDYPALFDRIDMLILLAAPSFETVFAWRTQQEHALRTATGRGMTDEQVTRFVFHYERITRHILAEMPGRADLVIRLAQDRSAVSIDS